MPGDWPHSILRQSICPVWALWYYLHHMAVVIHQTNYLSTTVLPCLIRDWPTGWQGILPLVYSQTEHPDMPLHGCISSLLALLRGVPFQDLSCSYLGISLYSRFYKFNITWVLQSSPNSNRWVTTSWRPRIQVLNSDLAVRASNIEPYFWI